MRPFLTVLALLAALLAATPGHGQERRRGRDFEAARQAVQNGEALPLSEILARVGGALPGQIVGVEIERDDGVWIYEFRVVDAAGRRREVHVDALTGALRERGRR